MTDTPSFETSPEYIRRMADDGAGDLADLPTVESNLSASFSDLGTVITDPGDIPGTASIRPNGVFTNADDLREYLDQGGLITYDTDEKAVPFSWIYILEAFDEVLQEQTWQVYIDSQTDPS